MERENMIESISRILERADVARLQMIYHFVLRLVG